MPGAITSSPRSWVGLTKVTPGYAIASKNALSELSSRDSISGASVTLGNASRGIGWPPSSSDRANPQGIESPMSNIGAAGCELTVKDNSYL